MLRKRPLRVAALVDLTYSRFAGGHVKCWQRLAGAARAFADELDLTIFFSAAAAGEERVSDNVRYVLLPPLFSTARIPFLSSVPDHTDLAPWHPGLARKLFDFDVFHTTDAYFAFARTAERAARRQRRPLVNSIHTDTPNYARVFAERIVEGLFGGGCVTNLLIGRLEIHERAARRMERRLANHQASCHSVLVSRSEDRAAAEAILSPERVGMLRRGIDKDLFNPKAGDRRWLHAAYGVPLDRVLVFFAGRMNRGKNILTLAKALRGLIDRGRNIHFLCAGEGEDRAIVQSLLGGSATCPGAVEEAVAARFFACADLFAQPSEIEIYPNVIMEALASGTPVVAARKVGMGGKTPGAPLIEVSGGVGEWEAALEPLVSDPEGLRSRGGDARAWAEANLPSWEDVLGEDLLPHWVKAATETCRVR